MNEFMYIVWDCDYDAAVFPTEKEAKIFLKKMELKAIEDDIELDEGDLRIVKAAFCPDVDKFYNGTIDK